MSKVLHIIAHPNPAQSRTVRIANSFVAAYKETHPQDEIEVLDLYRTGIHHLMAPNVAAIGKQHSHAPLTPEEQKAWDEMMGYVNQFKAADKVIVTAPMWNLSIPSILKDYLDHIILSGYTFQYTAEGPRGMMGGRKMVIINTTGGQYSQPPMNQFEHCESYLHAIFGFVGFEIVATVRAEGLDMVGPEDSEKFVQGAMRQAEEAARGF